MQWGGIGEVGVVDLDESDLVLGLYGCYFACIGREGGDICVTPV